MSTVISSDKHYKALAEKIRNVLGTTIEYEPSEMASEILSMRNMKDNFNSITNGVVYSGRHATIIGDKMQIGMLAASQIDTCEIPTSITSISGCAFYYSEIKDIVLHEGITSIGVDSFSHSNIKTIKLPNTLTSIGNYAFYWSDLVYIDIPDSVQNIGIYAFNCCDSLKVVILRKATNAYSLGDTNVFEYSSIEDGTGYIYVPSALLESYKTAANWSTFANQFRALEDYTVDGTVTGEFDYSKI